MALRKRAVGGDLPAAVTAAAMLLGERPISARPSPPSRSLMLSRPLEAMPSSTRAITRLGSISGDWIGGHRGEDPSLLGRRDFCPGEMRRTDGGYPGGAEFG
jgi:hypothetical protein